MSPMLSASRFRRCASIIFASSREKLSARKQLKATLLFRLMQGAEQGNATSIEKLFKRIDKLELAELQELVANRGGKPDKKGKKEQAHDAAGEVSGKFAPPKPPSSLVN
jgi:hypothetical protein